MTKTPLAESCCICEWPELERLAAAGADSSSLPQRSGRDTDGQPSYEDMCKAHIDAFINAAAAAEVQTELASRCVQMFVDRV